MREYGIPQDKVGWALSAFNVGVEAGQLVIVALAFTALPGMDAWSQRLGETGTDQRSRAGVWSVSAGIFVLGLFWAWERTNAWLVR